MRKLILLAFLFVAFAAGAQTFVPTGSCKAVFTYSINPQIDTLASATSINFLDMSDGDIISWNWDFGDGETSTEQNPLHIFSYPVRPRATMIRINPYRTVTLTIATSDSCISTYSETINIYDIPGPGDKTCKSDFYFFQTGFDSITQTASVKFMNMSGGESPSYSWDFGDGITSTEAEPEVTFDLSRLEREVCLTVNGTDSCSDVLCQIVPITAGGGTVPGDSVYPGCFTAFGYYINTTIQTFAPALVLDFYAKPSEPLASCFWDFGDGTTSSETDPTHIFNFPVVTDSILGDPNPFRTVCLTVTSQTGCVSTYCETINIYMNEYPADECNAWFSYYVPYDQYTIPEVIPYRLSASARNIVSWTWSFEDGTVSYEPEPLVTFDIFKPTQKVCLTILTSDSCTSSWCETIQVSPVVIDTIYPQPTCGYRFRFTSSFPEWVSSCQGTASAQVVLGDSLIPTEYYYWTTPDGQMVDGQVLTNMCPTETYSVTALTTDGCKFTTSFIFNSDGTITEIPISWWIAGWGEESYVDYILPDSTYSVEWIGCDGTVYTDVTVLLNDIICDTGEPNMILKDARGNIIYARNIAFRLNVPVISNQKNLMLYPNPVTNRLNIYYKGTISGGVSYEISSLTGQVVQKGNLPLRQSGQIVGVDVSALNKGIYIGKVISGNRVIAVDKFTK